MATTSYYVAVSLDGFLAREDGTVDWLSNYTAPLETPYDYEPFYQTVSAVVMGRKTYDTVISFGEYTYKGKPGLVLSKNAYLQINEPGVESVSLDWKERFEGLKASAKDRIWLVGGGEVASLFVKENLLDVDYFNHHTRNHWYRNSMIRKNLFNSRLASLRTSLVKKRCNSTRILQKIKNNSLSIK